MPEEDSPWREIESGLVFVPPGAGDSSCTREGGVGDGIALGRAGAGGEIGAADPAR